MEVGDYIRTKNGEIGKVIEIKKRKELADKIYLDIRCNDEFCNVVYDFDIKSHSKNIIDLIEVGDIVNGCEVMNIYKPNKPRDIWEPIEVEINSKWTRCFLADDIKTILTHEMYEQNCYKVGEEK